MMRFSSVLLSILASVGLSACLSMKTATIVEDTQNRFSYKITEDLLVLGDDGRYQHYSLESPAVDAYVIAVEASMEREGLEKAYEALGQNLNALEVDGISSFQEWSLEKFKPREDGIWTAVAYQYRDDTLYAFIASGGADSSPDTLPNPIMSMLTSFKFTELAGERFFPKTLTEFEEYIDTTTAQFGGGISVAAIQDGQLVYSYANGQIEPGIPATIDAIFHWGSITKLVTAVAIMREVEAGRIDLEATVDRYLPELPFGSRITVRNLLCHASGLPELMDVKSLIYFKKTDMPPLEEIWSTYVKELQKLVFEPGTTSIYSNYNFLALAIILERTTGQRLTDYVQTHVFRALNLGHTFYFSEDIADLSVEANPVLSATISEPLLEKLSTVGYDRLSVIYAEDEGHVYTHPIDIPSAWGGVKSTAEDAARFGWMLLNDGLGSVQPILNKTTVRSMKKAQKTLDGKPLPFGLAIKIFRDGKDACLGHNGGGPGIESRLRLYPRHKLVIAVLGSTDGYGADIIVEHLKNLLIK